jgi:phage baseplate assembly protein W
MTDKGERIMRPDYGTSIRRILFEGDAEFIVAELKDEIVRAIAKFEPRASVVPNDVEIEIVDNDVIVTVNYGFFDQKGKISQNISLPNGR